MTAPNVNATVGVTFRAIGVSTVSSAARRVSEEAGTSLERVGRATQRIATGFTEVARTGELAGRGLNEVLKSVSEIAFSFGPTGLFIGALGIAGTAIYEHLTKPMKDAEEQAKQTAERIAELANAGNVTQLQQEMQKLSQGSPGRVVNGEFQPSKVSQFAPNAFEGSLADMEAHMAKLMADLAEAEKGGQTSGGFYFAGQIANLNKQIQELTPALEAARKKWEQLKAAFNVAQTPYTPGQVGAVVSTALSPAALAKADAARAAAIQKIMNTSLPGIAEPIAAANPFTTTDIGLKALKAPLEAQVNDLGQFIEQSIASTIGDALAAGFDAAFSGKGIAGAISAFGQGALKTLGGMFKEIGEKALIGLSFMKAIKDAIDSWNPAVGLAAAIGLIALGSALQAAGSSGGKSGGSSYGYATNSGAYAPAPIVVNPNSMPNLSGARGVQPVTVNATIIGDPGPRAARQLADMVTSATRRVS